VIFTFSELVRSVSNTRIFIDLHLSRQTHLHDARRLSHVRGVSVWKCPRGAILKSPAISRKELLAFSNQKVVGKPRTCYGVATISRLLKIIGLFCKRVLQNRRYSAKETHNLRSLLIVANPYLQRAANLASRFQDFAAGVTNQKNCGFFEKAGFSKLDYWFINRRIKSEPKILTNCFLQRGECVKLRVPQWRLRETVLLVAGEESREERKKKKERKKKDRKNKVPLEVRETEWERQREGHR